MNESELKRAIQQIIFADPIEDDIEIGSWKHRRLTLRDHILKDDPRRMLRWSTIRAVMFVNEPSYIRDELNYLLEGQDLKWKLAIREPSFGEPRKLSFYHQSSGNLVHQAYHLKLWEEHAERKIEEVKSIFEFGGGYGAMALVARQAGFEGRYILHDFPDMLLLQNYYLSHVRVDAEYMREIEETEVDLFIACFSISEAPLETRFNALNKISANAYLFVFQDHFEGVNNNEFFYEFTKSKNLTWYMLETATNGPHFYYLIGA